MFPRKEWKKKIRLGLIRLRKAAAEGEGGASDVIFPEKILREVNYEPHMV